MTTHPTTPTTATRYLKPDRFTRSVMNPILSAFVRAGLSMRGASILTVRGRVTGDRHRIPVNVLAHNGAEYLVAPRGQTEWVRNLRAAGEGSLLRRWKRRTFTVAEVDDGDKLDLLRAYLDRWSTEVGRFFEPLTASSPPAAFAEVSSGFPVFEIIAADG